MPGIIGRDAEIRDALRTVRSAGRLVISGVGGIGKSSLAREVADQLSPERRLWVDAEHLRVADEVVARTLAELGEVPVPGESALDALTAAVDGRVLVVIDGADEAGQDLYRALDPLPTAGDGPWLLVVTRFTPELGFAPIHRLGPLADASDDSPAMEMFRAQYTAAGGRLQLLEESPAACRRVVADSAGIPLAIAVAAARVAVLGFDQFGSGPSSGADAVTAAIERTVEHLDNDAVRVFTAFGVLAGAATAPDLAVLSGLAPDRTVLAVERLSRYSLVHPSADGFTTLPPIRRAARSLGTALDQYDEATRRHRDWVGAQYQNVRRSDAVVDIIRLEPELRAAVEYSVAAGRWDDAADCAQSLFWLRGASMHQLACREVLEALVSAADGQPGLDAHRRTELVRELAIARGETDGAAAALPLLDAAAAHARQSDQPARDRVRVMATRAAFIADCGDLTTACRTAFEAAELGRRCGDDYGWLRSLRVAAEALCDLGRLDEADATIATVLAHPPGNHRRIRSLAQGTQALIALERGALATSLAIARAMSREADATGHVDLRLDAELIRTFADPAGASGEPIPVPDRQSDWVLHLEAQLCRTVRAVVAGDSDLALLVASDVVTIAGAVPKEFFHIDGLLLLGGAAVVAGDKRQAQIAYRQALDVADRHGYALRVPDALDGLAVVSASQQADTAAACATAAAEIRRLLGAGRRPTPWLPEIPVSPAATLPTSWLDGHRLGPAARAAITELAVAAPPTRPHAPRPIDRLSPAERQVAVLVADGHTNRDIAAHLNLARRTVETHIAHAFQKLQVSNRTQLATAVAGGRHPG